MYTMGSNLLVCTKQGFSGRNFNYALFKKTIAKYQPYNLLVSTQTYLNVVISTAFLHKQMISIDRKALSWVQKEKIQPLGLKNLKYILVDSVTEDQLAELQTSVNVLVIIKKSILVEDKLDRKTLEKPSKSLGEVI